MPKPFLYRPNKTICISEARPLFTEIFWNNKFTSKAEDWELYYKISCEKRVQANQIENHLKKMKSSKYLRNLVKYPEISEKLQVRDCK